MTSRIISLAAMLPLFATACIPLSVRGMRERKPVLVETSQRSVKAISDCVTKAWIDEGLAVPKTLPRDNGLSLVQEITVTYTMVAAMLDLETRSSGTYVEFRTFTSINAKQNRKEIDQIRACL